MRSLTAALAAALTVLAASFALADPVVRHQTCDHSGIESQVTKRHVNYLSTQLACDRAQHIARLWVHSHDCGAAACNVWEGTTAIAYCTSRKDSTGEWLTRCGGQGYATLIGWKRIS